MSIQVWAGGDLKTLWRKGSEDGQEYVEAGEANRKRSFRMRCRR